MSSAYSSNLSSFARRLSLHSPLSPADQLALQQLPTRTVQASANQDFVRLGEYVDHCCFIVEGLAARFGESSAGDRQFSALHIPGDMADLHSLVLPNPTSGIQALTTTTILTVPHTALRNLARGSPSIAEAFWRECSIDAAILSQWVVNVGRRDARARMAHLLCEMAVRYGATVDAGFTYRLPVTQNHLADATALTPVHVNRTLKSLREEGLVVARNRQIQIHNWTGLREVADFEDSYLRAVPPASVVRAKVSSAARPML